MRLLNQPMVHQLHDRINVTLSFPSLNIKQIESIFELSAGVEYDFDIKEHKNKRSLDANAYAWVLIGKLAEAQNLTTTEVYREQIKELSTYNILCLKSEAKASFIDKWQRNGIGWICEEFDSKIPGCVNIKAHYGSSEFDTKEMSRFIDNLIHECHESKIPIDESAIRLAVEEWGG